MAQDILELPPSLNLGLQPSGQPQDVSLQPLNPGVLHSAGHAPQALLADLRPGETGLGVVSQAEVGGGV